MNPETHQPMLFSTNYGMICNLSDINGCTAFSVEGEQDHVHFKNGSALNKDGTWKHGHGKLTNEQKQYLKQNGWDIE